MESRVTALKNNFNNISVIRNNVKEIFDFLQNRINKLKFFYSEFIKNNKTELFIFGLDSFHFQSRLIDIEYEGMYKIFRTINNRMYCEYFKLYKIIVSYIKDTINDKKLLELIKVNNFPLYKDLEPEKEYKFETIVEIHEHILILITSVIGNLTNKENEYKTYVDKNLIGLNIDNFVNTYSFEVIMMREKVKLFLTYIEFFHKLHTKYLQRFSNKIHLMNTHINDDIKFDETVKINKNSVIIDSKSNDNSNLLLSPRLNNISQKSPSFFKKSIDSVNSLFSNSKTDENRGINLIIDVNKSLEKEELNEQKIESAFLNIDDICNNLINNSTNKNENQLIEQFFDNPINNDIMNNIVDNDVENDIENNISDVIEEVIEIKPSLVIKQDDNNNNNNNITEEIAKNDEDLHNDDVSVLSLDSTICEEEDKKIKETIVKEEKEEKEEPKKKRTYKPRKKN
jgi:hypothetical protein